MFEAYKVGVTLSLQNQVSGVLGFIARDFMKVNAEAKLLQGSLKEIKLLGMGGALVAGAGFLGLGLIGRAVKPASEYVHQLQLAKAAGMSQLEIAQATTAAWKATGDVITTTATQNVAAIRELRMVFGDTRQAVEHMPTVQKLQAVLQNVRGGHGKDEAYTVAKALEMRGDVKNVGQFDTAADLMTRAIIASGGKVGASDFLSSFKYGRAATIGWDNRFTYGILPTLIQEMKTSGGSGGSGGPGNALMSAYASIVGGTISQRSLKTWQQLGLLDPSKIVWDKVGSAKGVGPGGVAGSAVFQRDPYEWTQTYLMPALLRAGFNTEDKQRQALQYLFQNRTAGFIMSQMALQPWKFSRDQSLISQAQGLGAYDQLSRHDPNMAEQALSAQWDNLKTAIGVTVIPVILPAMHGLTTAFNTLGGFLQQHPRLTSALTLTFTGLSALAAVGGTLMVAAAGIKLIGPVFTALGAVAPVAGSLLTAFTGLLPVMVALAAAAAPIIYHKEIANYLDKKTNGKVGDWLYGLSESMDNQGKLWAEANAATGFAPPPSGSKSGKGHGDVYLDGQKVGKIVTQHQTKAASGPATGSSWFDGRETPIWPSYNFGS